MYHKNNPWVSLVALLLLALILVLSCTGCHVEDLAEEENVERFTVEYAGKGCEILTDTETGVQYIAYRTPYGTGLAKLEG